jgi:hypothetical protein
MDMDTMTLVSLSAMAVLLVLYMLKRRSRLKSEEY